MAAAAGAAVEDGKQQPAYFTLFSTPVVASSHTDLSQIRFVLWNLLFFFPCCRLEPIQAEWS